MARSAAHPARGANASALLLREGRAGFGPVRRPGRRHRQESETHDRGGARVRVRRNCRTSSPMSSLFDRREPWRRRRRWRPERSDCGGRCRSAIAPIADAPAMLFAHDASEPAGGGWSRTSRSRRPLSPIRSRRRSGLSKGFERSVLNPETSPPSPPIPTSAARGDASSRKNLERESASSNRPPQRGAGGQVGLVPEDVECPQLEQRSREAVQTALKGRRQPSVDRVAVRDESVESGTGSAFHDGFSVRIVKRRFHGREGLGAKAAPVPRTVPAQRLARKGAVTTRSMIRPRRTARPLGGRAVHRFGHGRRRALGRLPPTLTSCPPPFPGCRHADRLCRRRRRARS